MSKEKHIAKTVFVLWLYIMAFYLSGCGKKQPDVSQAMPAAKEPAKGITVIGQYDNDIDRLNKISERLNRVCKSNYVVMLGAGPDKNNILVTVDYKLFDSLSDDGVAVMIAESIVRKSVSPTSQIQPGSQIRQVQNSNVLNLDFTVGQSLAAAGFSSNGFNEWLDTADATAGSAGYDGISKNARIKAFIDGFTGKSGR